MPLSYEKFSDRRKLWIPEIDLEMQDKTNSQVVKPRLLLVDGHYYLYRSFHSVQGLKNSKGEPTNAIYAFAKAVRRMVAELRPTHAAVLWDSGLPQRRVDLLPAYKQQRSKMPEELKAQEKFVMEMCPFLGLSSIFSPRVEADDLIAAYAKAAPQEMDVVIATSDKDIYQIVSSQIRIYSPTKSSGKPENGRSATSNYLLLGPQEVLEKWGVSPNAIRDVLSLMGDSSDNIPGVPGIGKVTATKLIQEFGSVENLVANAEKISKDGVRKKIQAPDSQEIIRTNYQLVGLFDDEELPRPIEDLRFSVDYKNLIRVFAECEFTSLLQEVRREAGEKEEPMREPEFRLVQGDLFSWNSEN